MVQGIPLVFPVLNPLNCMSVTQPSQRDERKPGSGQEVDLKMVQTDLQPGNNLIKLFVHYLQIFVISWSVCQWKKKVL